MEPLASNYAYTSIQWNKTQGTTSYFSPTLTNLEAIWTGGPGTLVVNYIYNEPDNPGPTWSGTASLQVTVITMTDPVYTVSGGGETCSGSSGVSVSLSGSVSGVNYQLVRGGQYVGPPKNGNGFPLNWPNLTVAGSYTVLAFDPISYCSHAMSGTATISPGPPPAIFNVGGGGVYAVGEVGPNITLNGSEVGVSYQLRLLNANVGSAAAGTGNALVWPGITTGGTYTIRATNSTTFCTSVMTGDAVVIVYPLPQLTCPNQAVPYSITLPSGPNVGNVQFLGWSIIQGVGSISNPQSIETTVTWSSGPGHLVAEYSWEELDVLAPPLFIDYVVHYESQHFSHDILAPKLFEVSGGGSVCAGAPGRTISLSGSELGFDYQLRLGGSNVSQPIHGNISGGPISWTGISGLGTYTVRATHVTEGCTADMTGTAILSSTPSPSQYSPTATSDRYRRAIVQSTGMGNPTTHYWQTSPLGTVNLNGTSTSSPVTSTLVLTNSSVVYIGRFDVEGNCWSYSSGLSIELNNVPPAATVIQAQSYGYNTIDLNLSDETFALQHAEYFISASENVEADPTKLWTPGYKVFGNQTYYVRGRDIATGSWGPITAFDVALKKDYDLNYILAKSFDASKDEVLLAESKQYFDNAGKVLQAQTHNVASNKIFLSEVIKDQYERIVGSFLPAPLDGTQFRYHPLLSLTTDGDAFNFNDFDNPVSLSDTYPGTIGWYYSDNNTDESNTPATTIPYSRKTFYQDGFGETLASSRPGEVHKIGSGHESLSGTFPVHNELGDYLTRRIAFLPGIIQDNNLLNEGVQTVIKDENGVYPITKSTGYSISITDKSGKVVMSARPGTAANKVLTVVNTINANTFDPNSLSYKPFVYFYILTPQVVTISGTGNWTIEDIVTNTIVNPIGQWPAGFYRVKADASTDVQITYANYYLDVSYQFYDDAGRLRVSLSPNGYEQWVIKGITDITKLDKTSYTYNHQGWLLEMTEADADTTKYGYRKDGKIRFSQNAKQRGASGLNRFSYTNYDDLGRPVESGEYTPANTSEYFDQVRFNSTTLETIGNSWMQGTSINDWVKTHYDLPAAPADHPGFSFPAGYVQKFLRGAVSWMENKNMLTYYSYNEKGQVTWMIQRPKALTIGSTTLDMNKSFLLQYNYDPTGNVVDVTYVPLDNSGNLILSERFIHYYEYDASKRLVKTLSGTDGVHKKLRAQYYYYLHGPLKRIELGDNLQGIDFIYNIHGWLTAINDPNTANDPGGDGNPGTHQNFKKDAFGMILDYYESSLGGLFTANLLEDPNYFHRIPELFKPGQETSIALDSPRRDLFGNNESLNEIRRVMQYVKATRTKD
ncbi:MAG: hypothetical protein JNL40_01735 [Cyclobacteriaceae bacterium]|nr:hypothetical protein [Cyclobacteriaceae bacterium]